jgi:hypothetical protein
MGFANFYRRFIENFSKIVKPLMDLTKDEFKGKKFEWSDAAERAFKTLKPTFTSAPILRYFDPRLLMVIETNVRNFAIGAILLQVKNGYLKLVAFHSRKMDKVEINYNIHDKEILAIISTFKEWPQYLEGTSFKITVYSDHKNLEYFATTKVLNCHQARWSQDLARYDFKIVY